MRSALSLDLDDEVSKMPRHRQSYLAYMKHAVETTTLKPVEYELEKLRESSEGALITAVGEALPQILMGEIDPLEVFFGGKLADDFYQRGFGAPGCFAQLGSYLDVLTHKNPALKFLVCFSSLTRLIHCQLANRYCRKLVLVPVVLPSPS